MTPCRRRCPWAIALGGCVLALVTCAGICVAGHATIGYPDAERLMESDDEGDRRAGVNAMHRHLSHGLECMQREATGQGKSAADARNSLAHLRARMDG